MSDATFDDFQSDGFLERLFGAERLKRGWRVLIPANENAVDEDLHPAYIAALLKRRRSW
ncbi:MAG: hypothetical protein RIB45_00555 [Marivibrio sp.]|uniref:hypothetical protein n=1 Tax=Marivibrio sp. TaxID=2039719 RepID=UPI0032EC6717